MEHKVIYILFFVIVFPLHATLHIINISPTNRQKNITSSTNITIQFDKNILSSSVNSYSIFVMNSDRQIVPINRTVSGDTITLNPLFELEPNEFYITVITTNVKSTDNDLLLNKEYRYFYTTCGSSTPHTVSGINWTNDTGWETNDYITYDYSYSEVAVCEPWDTTPSWCAITNFWISWDTNSTYYRIKTLPGNLTPFYTLFCIDTTRDDSGATTFTAPDGTVLYFSNYRLPEIIYLQTNAGGSYWRSDKWTIYNWNGSSWDNIGVSGCQFKNIKDYSTDTGLSVKIPDIYFTNGSITGSKPNRIAVKSLNIHNGLQDSCPEDGSWVTYDFDNNCDDIADGSPTPPPPPLQVITTSPFNGEIGVNINKIIYITFSSNINASSVTTTNFILYDSANLEISGTRSVSNNVIKFIPSSDLNILENYTVVLGTTIESTSGTSLISSYYFSFTTAYVGPFYVHATLGDDNNGIGTVSNPFKTISRALTEIKSNTINTCYIQGTYTSPVELGIISGFTNNMIVLTKWSNDWKIQGASYGLTFYTKSVNNIIIKHLTIDSPSTYGVDIKTTLTNIQFISNRIQGTADRGVYFESGSANSDNIKFISTTFDGFTYPLIIQTSGLGTIEIKDSVIKNGNNYCIYMASDIDKLIVANSIMSNNTYGMLCASGSTIQTLIITNSKLLSNGYYGVLMQGTIKSGKIVHSFFTNHSNEGIYASGSLNNFMIRDTIFVSSGQYTLYFSATSNLKLINNRIKDSSSSATYFGGATKNLIFQSNILVNNASYGFYSASSGNFADEFRNNVIVGNTSYAVLLGQNFESFTMRNNTISPTGSYGVSLRSSGIINFRNNIITKQGTPGGTGFILSAGSITNAYNNIYNFSTLYSGTTAGAGALSTASLYRDTNVNNWLGTNFYRLQEGSPCIDAGDPSDPVPSGGGSRIDMGAFDSSNASSPPELYITNNYSVSGTIADKYVPGNTITITIKYDNDAGGANGPSIEVTTPTNTIYVSQSASQSNNYHTGESGTIVEVYNGTSWVSDTGVYDANQIKKIRWIFQQDIAGNDNSEGTDTDGKCDGDFPDSDSGIVTYKVIIK